MAGGTLAASLVKNSGLHFIVDREYDLDKHYQMVDGAREEFYLSHPEIKKSEEYF
jgi:hypothetical protein